MIAVMKSGWERMRASAVPVLPQAFVKNLMPLVLLAVGITAVVLMYLWGEQAGYKPIFGAREKVVASDMMSVLDAEHIPYRIHPESGQVLVPEKMMGKVRMLLAAKGVVAKLPAGLELMDRSDPLGVSQFVQDIRFRRGLEGELAQSIQALDAVDVARVHLSIAKSTSFVMNDGAKSSASVVLALKPGRQLTSEQIAAIVNMVAGSVSSLDPQRVSLVDQAGNLLSAHIDLSQGFDAVSGGEAAKHYQEAALRNVRDLLTPVLGENNFKASVTAEIDDDRVEETVEKFGEEPKVTAEAMREEQDRAMAAIGIPGSLSNRPVNPPTAETGSAPQTAEANTNTARKNASTRQFAYDRSIKQIKRSRNRLSKLNVSVLLNNAAAPKGGGWSNEELLYIENMLRNGLGINGERGDKLAVSALPFSAARPEPLIWWQQRDTLIDIGTPVIYLIAALLAYFLLARPLVRTVQAHLAPVATVPQLAESTLTPITALEDKPIADATSDNHQQAIGQDPMPVVSLLENYDLPPPGSPVDVMVNHLRVLAAKEPERVAEVVKQWVQKHGRVE